MTETGMTIYWIFNQGGKLPFGTLDSILEWIIYCIRAESPEFDDYTLVI